MTRAEFKQAFKHSGLTMRDISAASGVSKATLEKWMYRPGGYSPNLGNFNAVLNVLGYEVVVQRLAE